MNFLKSLERGISDQMAFLRAFLREPARIGAVTPSSRFLAKEMIRGFELQTADTVVEIGPGTGSFTRLILERLGKQTEFLALELDPHNASRLRERFPQLHVYNDSAERIAEYLTRHGKTKADYIISGLPWANLGPLAQQRILDAILSSLAEEGIFATFAYAHARWLPKALQFRKRLQLHFLNVQTSSLVWANLPPAVVYRCSKVRCRNGE